MMRALTLTQPWAGLVASGIKLVENRPRRMIKSEDFGKRFAIHASRQIDADVYSRIREIAPELYGGADGCLLRTELPWWSLSRITSAVIAVATLDGSIEPCPNGLRVRHWADRMSYLDDSQRRWFFGPVGYVLRDVVALREPVPCKGALGFWRLPEDVEQKVRAQL